MFNVRSINKCQRERTEISRKIGVLDPGSNPILSVKGLSRVKGLLHPGPHIVSGGEFCVGFPNRTRDRIRNPCKIKTLLYSSTNTKFNVQTTRRQTRYSCHLLPLSSFYVRMGSLFHLYRSSVRKFTRHYSDSLTCRGRSTVVDSRT